MTLDFEKVREKMKFPVVVLLLAIVALCWPATVMAGIGSTSKCSRSKFDKVKKSYASCVRQKQEYFRSKNLSSVGSVQVQIL